VIDFGTSGVGDPACDLAIAWTLFSGESRETFRAALPLDEVTWARGRGWTLWKALITLAALPGSDARAGSASRRIIDDVLGERKSVSRSVGKSEVDRETARMRGDR
jgi:aminoglycoside phosphotransferase (APT) family kinase protein